jgi:thiosulfate/3-mercaptopyruvate sulfurtransferase
MKILSKKTLLIITVVLALVTAFGCTIDTRYDDAVSVVEASEVKSMMADPNVVVIDARSADEFGKGHLKGAVNLSPDALNAEGEPPAMLGSKEQFEAVMSEAGISNDMTVLIYDASGGVQASRLWWAMKSYGHADVRVINQGAQGLEKQAMEMSLEVMDLQATAYEASDMDSSMYASIDDVKSSIESGEGVLIDVRTRAEFDEGAIPTAINYSHTNNTYTDGSFKSVRDIYLNYTDLGIKKDTPVILYCKSSYRATQTALLMKEAGFENVRVYDGAWLEWSTAGDVPVIEVEDQVPVNNQDAS